MNRNSLNPAVAARNLAAEINLLRGFGVSSGLIAGLFQTTAANIRQIVRRSQYPEELKVEIPPEPIRYSVREDSPIYGLKRKKLEEQEYQVEELFRGHSASYQFEEGSRILRAVLAEISAPTHPRRMRLRARIHHHIAWFAVQQGHCKTAVEHANLALSLGFEVYKRTWDPFDLSRYVETALVLSMATHLSVEGRDPRREQLSLQILKVAQQAAAEAKNPRGSEHYRQIGSALLHVGAEQEAKKELIQARKAAISKGEAHTDLQADMLVSRHLNLIDTPNWDGAQELLGQVEAIYGRASLQYAIHANYAAAAALITDSHSTAADAIDLLENNAALIDQSGRQATVRKLLSITPELWLNPQERQIWVLHALRANGLRKY